MLACQGVANRDEPIGSEGRGQSGRRRRETGSGGHVGSGGAMGREPGMGRGKGQRQREGRGQGAGQGSVPRQRQRQGQESVPRRGPSAPRRGRRPKLENMKPNHPEEQEIPFRLRELIKSRQAMKRPGPGKKEVAEKKQQPRCRGPRAQGDIPVPRFRRGKGESERSYVYRMEQEVQRVLFLSKNQLQREPEKEGMAPEKSKRKKEFQNKRLEKARRKKEEKKEDMLEKSLLQDTVAFGEVVTQPPTITSRPRGRGPAEQAGRKRLLLTTHLGHSPVSPVSPAAPMSLARQRIVEEERARVIQAYRDIQRHKQQQRELAQDRGRAGRRVPR
ncbi:coiled-coil domain-containing protein 137 [Phaethornis superciliosus]